MMDTQAVRIIRAFGTQQRLAEALKTRQSTISGWKKSGWVPAHRQPHVIAAARRLGIALTADDFLPPSIAHDNQHGEERAPCP